MQPHLWPVLSLSPHARKTWTYWLESSGESPRLTVLKQVSGVKYLCEVTCKERLRELEEKMIQEEPYGCPQPPHGMVQRRWTQTLLRGTRGIGHMENFHVM